MFTDKRSKKVVFVAHCILNQNAKIDRCAHYPGAMPEVTQTLLDAGIGMVQLPCPELLILGLDRRADMNKETTIASEDTRVATLMQHFTAKAICDKLAKDVLYQAEEYAKNGFDVLGVLGINGSPTCGVEFNWGDDCEEPRPGVFMQAIQDACKERAFILPMRGVRASQPEEAVNSVKALIS